MNALGEISDLHHNETCKRGFIYSFTGDTVIQIFPDIEHVPKRLSAFWALILQATDDDFLLHYNGLQGFRIKRIGVYISV